MNKIKSRVAEMSDRLLSRLVPHAGTVQAAQCFTWCWCERYEDGSALKCKIACPGLPIIEYIKCQFCC